MAYSYKCVDCSKNAVCISHKGSHKNCFVPISATNEDWLRTMTYFEARRQLTSQIQELLGGDQSPLDEQQIMLLIDNLYEWLTKERSDEEE